MTWNNTTEKSDGVISFGGIKHVKANELVESYGLCACIEGAPGVGKGWLIAQAADSEYGKPLLIGDIEGGIRTISDRHDIDVAPLRSWADFTNWSNDIMQRKSIPFKSISLDNLTELQELGLKAIRPTGQRSWPDYMQSTGDILTFVRRWRDWAQKTGVNVFMAVHEETEKEEAAGIVKLKKTVGFTPALAKHFPGQLDMIGWLTADSEGRRCLTFRTTNKSDAKFRKNASEAAQTIPLEIWYTEKEKPLVDLLATLKGGVPFPADKYKKKV